MRKLGLIVLLVLFGSSFAVGQTVEANYGIKSGVGVANFYGDEISNVEGLTGFNGGFFATFQLHNNLYLQPEFLFTQKGASGNFILSPDEYSSFEIGYIQIPILPTYQFEISPDISANVILGPALSVKIYEDITVPDGRNNLFETTAQKQEFSVIGGVGLNIKRLIFDLRYDMGVTNALDRTNSVNGALSLSAGYIF